ncbi:MAG TPA: efflux transporter outer membrane subunit [Steroidobacteraceae bacterium]|nr:efflux transporter outer membrane subunit [Steroidobacteraceae bacterium]
MRREFRRPISGCTAALAVVCAVMLAGCALTREPVDTPQLPLPEALPAVEGAAAELPSPWWALFADDTLDALVREALEYNADLQAATARVAEARALAGISRADRLPGLDLEAGVTRGRDSALANPGLPGVDATRTDYGVRGVVSYEVDLWGRYAHASEAARLRLLATEFDRDALRLSLTGETARAYFALAAAIAQFEQARATLASREESLRIERLRFEGGESDEITWRRVEAEAEQARALMREFEFAVGQRQNVLGVLTGRTPRDLTGQRILPRAMPVQTTVPRLPAGLPADVLVRRPDVRAAEAQIAAAAGDVGAARAALLPGISLTGAYGSASTELGDLFTNPADVWSVTGALLQPIFQGGRLRSNVARTRALQQQRQAEYAGTVRRAFREVLDGLQGQDSLRAVEAARAVQVASLRRATELAELRYAEGEIAYLELLDVRRGLFAAEIELVAARRAALANTVDLALALGGGAPLP